MSKQLSRGSRPHQEHIQKSRIAATMHDGPKTFAEIVEHFYGYLKVLGLFRMAQRNAQRREAFIREILEGLIENGWVMREGECYALTPKGCQEVDQRFSELGQIGAIMRKFLIPKNVSKVTLGIHLTLVAVKLPVAFLSGSVGLLNDAADTLLDAASSILVYLGFRFNREWTVNLVLVILMLITGSITFYEAVRRFFVITSFEVNWLTFLTAILSAFICLALWAYQRFVGLHSGSIALLTQSVDSRNHVIVAAGVTVGLIASLLRFSLIDTLVGLIVSLLILKSAVELAIEAIRSRTDEVAGPSFYKFGLTVQFERFRQMQLRDWMLYLVDGEGIQSRDELVARGNQALDSNRIPGLQAMGLAPKQSQAGDTVEQSLTELIARGWLAENEQMSMTDAGREHLRRWV